MRETAFQLEHGAVIAAQFADEQHIMKNNGGPGYGCSRRAARIVELLRTLNGGECAVFLTLRPEQPGSQLTYRGYAWYEHTICANPERDADGRMLTVYYDPILASPVSADDYAELMFPGQALIREVR